ncbi:CaiB/BaiF CoA transferase family protein [Chloroflexota bacterium]
MPGPLQGIRVLDLGRFVACPYCGMLLADLGAEVIRVERVGGGEDRYLGILTPTGESYGFSNQNRNKKGITLNFERNARAKELLNELVKISDVVIENFAVPRAEELGVTYENFKKIKPDIIFGQVSAFGPTGPYQDRLGFDMIAKAMSGSMPLSGFPGDPMRDQIFYIDYSTATLTAVGVIAALYHRKNTGEGQMIDTALLQTAVTYMAPYIGEWETGKLTREQVGNRAYWMGPCDLYKTKDEKWVYLAIITNGIWRRFCRFIGREDLITDPRFSENDLARWEQRDILDPIVSEWVASQTAEEVVEISRQIPIPCGICYSHYEVANDPHVKAREMLMEIPTPEGKGTVTVTGLPIRMSGTPTKVERPYPAVGQHNEEIYGGLLGYSLEDMEKLKAEEII